MVQAEQSSIEFNLFVLDELVRLNAVEAAEPIERAFAGGRLDVSLIGGWEVVRRKLGVEGLGLKMPENSRNSSEQLRIDEGIGIFSPRAVFGDGETDDEAAADYRERVSEAFSASSEGQQVIQPFGTLAWYASLLDFGIQYLGEIVDAMSPASVREFVLDYIPRKVSAEPDAAAGIIFELTKFWEFLDREGQLPNAQAIVDWLKADDLPGQLEEEMSDPENCGMAKSMFLMGRRAGFDMTTEAGMNEFVANFNKSRGFAVPRVTATRPPAANGRLAPASPVGRNDPSPCGSGKKFKKCCLRRA